MGTIASEYTDDMDGTSEASDDSDGDVGITNEEVCIPLHTVHFIADFEPAC